MTDQPPIQRFLGSVRLEHGPFGLLGLEPGPSDAAAINRALRAQLARLARHPQGMSTEADEVRLVLHVAAAQLRDPEVQREVLVECSYPPRARAEAPLVQAATGRRQPPAPRPMLQELTGLQAHTSRLAMFERAALWVLVHSGGWNKDAQRRLGSLAHTFDIQSGDFRRTLSKISRRAQTAGITNGSTNASVPPTTNGIAVPSSEPYVPISGSSWLRLAMLITLAVLTGVMVWRIVDIRMSFLKHSPSASVVNQAGPSSGGAQVPKFIERTIIMPGLPAPPTRGDGVAAPSETAAGAQESLPLPSSPDAHRPADVRTDEVVATWDRHARTAIDRSTRDHSSAEHLEHAVRLSLANLAAAQHWQGSPADARATQRRAESYRPPRLTQSSSDQRQLDELLKSLTSPSQMRDGDVGMIFLLARRQPARYLPELHQLRIGAGRLGPVDADVIAEAALFAGPKELRQLASDFIIRQADNPVMIYAILEALDHAPRHELGAELIDQVAKRSTGDVHDPLWPIRARQAILARLSEVLGHDATPGIDDLAEQFAENLRRTAVALGATGLNAGSAASAQHSARAAMQAVANRWREQGNAFTSATWFTSAQEDLKQRRELRLALAQGPIQVFAVEQAGALELMAELVRAERPSQTLAIDQVLVQLTRQRQVSTNVLQQVVAAERATCKIWRLRFGLSPLRGLK